MAAEGKKRVLMRDQSNILSVFNKSEVLVLLYQSTHVSVNSCKQRATGIKWDRKWNLDYALSIHQFKGGNK